MAADQAPDDIQDTALKRAGIWLRKGEPDKAVTVLIKAARKVARPRVFLREAMPLLRKSGLRYETLDCVDILIRRAPRDMTLKLRRADLLTQMGRHAEARDELDRTTGQEAVPLYWTQRIRVSHALDTPEATEALIATARRHIPDSAFLRDMQLRCLMARGALSEAQAHLGQSRADFPDHPGFDAQELRLRKALYGAGATLETARRMAREHAGNVWIQVILADCLEETGETDAAERVLQEAAAAFPASHVPPARLSRLAQARGDVMASLGWAERAQQAGRGILYVEAAFGRALIRAGKTAQSAAHLEDLMARGLISPALLRDLIQVQAELGQMETVRIYARRALTLFPDDPGLIRQLVLAASPSIRRPPEQAILAWAGAAMEPLDVLRLHADLHENACCYAQALEVLRRTPAGARDADHARRIIRLLLAMKRLRLAERYFRLSRRCWPEHPGLLALTFGIYSGLGDEATGLQHLQQAAKAAPERAGTLTPPILNFLADMQASDAALSRFEQARSKGMQRLLPPSVRLLQALLADGRGQETEALIAACHKAGIWGAPHFQITAYGQIATEARIALASPGQGALRPLAAEDTPGHVALMQAHPHSTIAGMRILRHWQARGKEISPPAETGTAIPRRIWQYWNSPTPPEGISHMIDSWRAAEGFEHRLLDRRGALDLLRGTFGPKWVRAFLLANNPAEESDFLRLALLAMHGGIYADADDILTGSLPRLVDRGAGLVALLEPGKRILGNNFIAAAPRHPAIVWAAKVARQALLARANETTWSKTGPALLTRAVAVYLARQMKDAAPVDISFLQISDLVDHLAIHNNAPHKRQAGDWRGSRATEKKDVFAELLTEVLQEKGLLEEVEAA